VLFPKKSKFNILFGSLDNFSDDFMQERIRPPQDNREDMF